MKVTWTGVNTAVVTKLPMKVVFVEDGDCGDCIADQDDALCSLLARQCMATVRRDKKDGNFQEVKD